MTDKEIVKALECWINDFAGKATQFVSLCNALDLINRQKETVEQLQTALFKCGEDAVEIENYKKIAENQQSISMDRFFEIKRLKEEIERLEADLKVKNQVLKDRELTPCPFDDDHERRTSYLHILNRKSAEIVKLEAEIDRLNYILQCYALEHGTAVDKERFLKPARAEAVKEFAEKLKKGAVLDDDLLWVTDVDIDNLVKEFTEGGDGHQSMQEKLP
jgi:hypothetical protein